MDFNLNPNDVDKIKKFVPADKLNKIKAVLSLIGGGNPQNLQFKCRKCNYQSSGTSFQREGSLACPKCQQKDLDVISADNNALSIDAKEETQNIYLNNSRPLAPNDKVITSNQRLKIALILIIIVTIAFLIYTFAR